MRQTAILMLLEKLGYILKFGEEFFSTLGEKIPSELGKTASIILECGDHLTIYSALHHANGMIISL